MYDNVFGINIRKMNVKERKKKKKLNKVNFLNYLHVLSNSLSNNILQEKEKSL